MEHNCSTLSLLIGNNKTKTRDLNFATIGLSCVNVWDLVRPVGVPCYLNLHLTRHSINRRPPFTRTAHAFYRCVLRILRFFWVGTRITGSAPDCFTLLLLPSNKFLPTCFLPTSAVSADSEHSRLWALQGRLLYRKSSRTQSCADMYLTNSFTWLDQESKYMITLVNVINFLS